MQHIKIKGNGKYHFDRPKNSFAKVAVASQSEIREETGDNRFGGNPRGRHCTTNTSAPTAGSRHRSGGGGSPHLSPHARRQQGSEIRSHRDRRRPLPNPEERGQQPHRRGLLAPAAVEEEVEADDRRLLG